MAATLESCTTPASSASAGARVLGTAELVGLIVADLTQPELTTTALVNRLFGSECARVLYRSPWIDLVRSQDNRLDALARSLTRHKTHFNDLGLGFDYDVRSNKKQLGRLFTACSPLTELEVGGITFTSINTLRLSLAPFASSLVKLTLHFKDTPGPDPVLILQLLSASSALRHLILHDLPWLGSAPLQVAPPQYRLSSLTLNLNHGLDHLSFTWLAGDSRATLRSVAAQHLATGALAALPELAPNLRETTLDVAFASRERIEAALRVAEQASVRRLRLGGYYCSIMGSRSGRKMEHWVAEELIRLSAEDRAKVILE